MKHIVKNSTEAEQRGGGKENPEQFKNLGLLKMSEQKWKHKHELLCIYWFPRHSMTNL